MTMRRYVLTLALFAAFTGTASAQNDLPPQLKADTTFSLTGVPDPPFDFRSVIAVDDAKGAATDTTLGRAYSVGRTQNLAGDTDLAIVARRTDGALDPTFAGDGTLELDITPGNDDYGVAIAVRPDHSLMVLGATDVSATATPNFDVALVPVAQDGTAGAPVVFDAGSDSDAPTAMALGGDDQVAITGSTDGATSEDTFVAVRNRDLSAHALRVVDSGGATVADRGVAVAWRPAEGDVIFDSVAVLIDIDRPLGAATVLREFDSTNPTVGGPDTAIGFDGASSVVGRGLTAFAGAYWATGTVTTSTDRDAWLARVSSRGLETRRFDIRGTEFPSTQIVNTDGY